MKRVYLIVAASVAFVGWLENPAHSLPNKAECQVVSDRLQGIAHAAGTEAVRFDGIRVSGIDHVAGAQAKRFEIARAGAVNALMDLLVAADELDRTFKTFCR